MGRAQLILLILLAISFASADTIGSGTTFQPTQSNVTYEAATQLTLDDVVVNQTCVAFTGSSLNNTFCLQNTTQVTYKVCTADAQCSDVCTNNLCATATPTPDPDPDPEPEASTSSGGSSRQTEQTRVESDTELTLRRGDSFTYQNTTYVVESIRFQDDQVFIEYNDVLVTLRENRPVELTTQGIILEATSVRFLRADITLTTIKEEPKPDSTDSSNPESTTTQQPQEPENPQIEEPSADTILPQTWFTDLRTAVWSVFDWLFALLGINQ